MTCVGRFADASRALVPDEVPTTELRSDSIRRNTALAFVAQLTAAAFTAGLTLFLVRALGPDGYGVYALALSISGLLLLPADLGISASAARFIAEHRGERAAIAGLVVDALRLKLLVALVLAGSLAVAAGPIAAAYDEPALRWPLRAMSVVLLAMSLMQLIGGSFTAMGRIGATLRIAVSANAVEALSAVALVLLGSGATGAAFGRSIGWTFAAVVGMTLIVRALGRSAFRDRAGRATATGRIARYAGALLLVDTTFSLIDQLGPLLIAAFLTTASVGFFQGPMRLAGFLHLPGLAVASSVAPRLARQAGVTPSAEAFEVSLRLLVVFQAALIAPLLVWAEPIVDLLLGGEYTESVGVLRALAVYTFLLGLAPVVSLAANYLGNARQRLPIALTALAVNAGLDLILIPRMGIVAAVIGITAAFGVYVPGHYLICQRQLDLDPRPLLLTLVRCGLAGAAMAGILYLAGTDELSTLDWLLGSVAGTAAYVLVLVATRELRRKDLRLVRDVVRPRTGA